MRSTAWSAYGVGGWYPDSSDGALPAVPGSRAAPAGGQCGRQSGYAMSLLDDFDEGPRMLGVPPPSAGFEGNSGRGKRGVGRCPRLARFAALIALSPLLVFATAANAGAPRMSPAGPNLLPNPGFEQAVPTQVPPGAYEPLLDTACQCNLLPAGWTYEGAAELFSMATIAPHSGHYDVVISGSLSGGTKFCEASAQVGCVANPTDPVKTAARQYYSLPPTWLTQNPIPVSAPHTYLLGSWVSWSTETVGQGVVLQARWLNAAGAPIGQSPVVTSASTPANNLQQHWTFVSGTVTAPAGATSVDVLLGATDDAWIGQVRFDDAYFGLAPHRLAAPKAK